ncbi:hypothetical protein [Phenylobacterium sp.]|uniref:hypothetical protein n=1 Tax=Phenylobacterium sp. TaxID=1871053 RepID=UPI0027346628|nr:hypothetical protein [Phenylobacterium sp.]MDP3660792.1 hypothetical protein [Phenylobacterium sp.]
MGPFARSIAGKVWNAPNTALGLAYGLTGHLVGEIAGKNPQISLGRNAIEFRNNPLTPFGALTLGNAIIYRDDPYNMSDDFWCGEVPRGQDNLPEKHEDAHTRQGEVLGPLYFPSNLFGGLAGLLLDRRWHGDHNWNEAGPKSTPPRPWPSRK